MNDDVKVQLWERETDTHIYFWGGIFSNFAYTPFRNKLFIDSVLIEVHTAEQLFMMHKALTFGDFDTLAKMAKEPSPGNCKSLGRKVKGYDDDQWAAVRYSRMLFAVGAKFASTPRMTEILMSTGDKTIVEASATDRIWGIGLAPEDDKVLDENNWEGQNLLGKVLMEVRDTVRETSAGDLQEAHETYGPKINKPIVW